MEEGLPIYHGQSHPRNSALGYYNAPTQDYQRPQVHSTQPPPPPAPATTTASSGQSSQAQSNMSFYPSSVASTEYYPRHDPYAPSAHYGPQHVVRNQASTPSSPYYYKDDHHINLDPPSPAPIRKAAGFRTVRDARVLRPSLQASHPTVGFFSLRPSCFLTSTDLSVLMSLLSTGTQVAHHQHLRYFQPVQSPVLLRVVHKPSKSSYEAQQACT